MEPITIAAGIAVAGALAQAYSAAQARGAQEEELRRIQDLFSKIVPPEYDVTVQDPPQMIMERIKSPEYAAEIGAPQFDMSQFKPEDLKLVGKYAPEAVPRIQEAAPVLIQENDVTRTGRDAQMKALKRFQEIGASEFDPEYQEAVTKARLNAQAEAQSRQQSILQDFARRGQSGSGLNLAAQMQSGTDAMNRNAMMGLEASSNAYRNRLEALSRSADLGGQVRGQDMDFQSRNAAAINEFNRRTSTAEQAYQTNRVNTINEAAARNLQAEQDLSNRNTLGRNEAAMADRNRMDTLARYQNDIARQNQQRADQMQDKEYGRNLDERNYQNVLRTNRADWQRSERDNQNKIKSQQYNDQMSKAQGMAGIGGQIAQNNFGAAQDRNAAIQGLSNIAMTYGMSRQAQADKDTDRAWMDEQRKKYGSAY